jgi:hypothetical protein
MCAGQNYTGIKSMNYHLQLHTTIIILSLFTYIIQITGMHITDIFV